jgi:predicted phage gp36 major capsid-like protein
MTEAPSPKTFDLGQFLAGRSYPEKTVNIYLDEAAGLTLLEMNKKLDRLSTLKDTEAFTELEAKQVALIESLNERRMQVTVRGVPRKVLSDIFKMVDTELPPKKDAFGREEIDAARDERVSNLLWAASIVKIVSPDGGEITPSETDIVALRELAPTADLRTIQGAIDEVAAAGDGFEVAARSVDFLSKP